MITKNEIGNIPPQGDINFRERKIEKNHTALLIIDLQKGEYNDVIIKEKPNEQYMCDRIQNVVIPNASKLINSCRENKIEVIYTIVKGRIVYSNL